MFSGALAGALKLGIVAVTAAGLGTSVYFIAEVGDAGDETSRLQAPATAQPTPDEAPDQLSPPNDITTPTPDTTPAPTPTFPPAPTPPAVDTSDWKTYTSPLGFSIKYPPDWVVTEEDSLSTGTARITRPLAEGVGAGDVAIEGGTVRLPPGVSVAWVEIAPMPFPAEFDAATLIELCTPRTLPALTSDRTQEITRVTVAGQPAVRCHGEGPDRNGDNLIIGTAYQIGLPDGGVFIVTAYVAGNDAAALALNHVLLASISFGRTQ